jgi:hypothetical protein
VTHLEPSVALGYSVDTDDERISLALIGARDGGAVTLATLTDLTVGDTLELIRELHEAINRVQA